MNLKNGKLKRDEPRLVQRVLRALGVPTEIVRIDIGSGANQYVFGSSELLAQFREQLAFFDAAAQRAGSPPLTTKRRIAFPIRPVRCGRELELSGSTPPAHPMNAPRENDPTELDRFKRDIDLVDYAQRQGYTIEKESRRGDWHHLVKDDEHVIVTRKGDHQVYLNTGDDRDAGSIIDFAKTRGGDGHGLNLGQVRQQLREYLDGAPAPARVYATPPDAARLSSLPVGDPEQARQAEEERRTRLISEVLGVKKEFTDRSYLHGRGITDATLDNPAFQGRIFTAQQNEHKNTAFPLYNEHGLASVEQKNEHYKSLLPLPKNGIWVSHPTEGKDTPVERVV
ncbi:DUF3991 domain-containing protein [Hymenobacter cellulosilyticus]|uniref:DUF3991 domain-containing protein n=1 Tax=Hymenobacter cellulosilyticus TaxID=2932248 RepID=A0A8T9QCK4_9BACT|nr:DUF3991 domain-containing protein [Hymenobacter cellulosilyticus]UOQ75266.1 DUF3991 domain-containing protein [Hymenobacter cellulosilyticus]